MSRRFRVDELARHVDGEVVGDGSASIEGVRPLSEAGPEHLSFYINPRYREAFQSCRAGAVLVGAGKLPASASPLIRSSAPYLALARLLELFHPSPEPPPGVHATAVVDPSASLGADVHVGAHAVIEAEAEIGDGAVVGAHAVIGGASRLGARSMLRPGVVLYPGTWVGSDCLIHSGVVLGGDGFGFASVEGVHHKVPQVGRVVVEDGVEIGANSVVDRAALGRTRIGAGSKLDALVMIGHGAELGEGCLLAGQAGISGSTRIGKGSIFAGQSGAAGHLELGPGTVVTAKSAVFGDHTAGGMISGVPAGEHRHWLRVQALVRKLPEMQQELRALRKRVNELETRPGSPDRDDRG